METRTVGRPALPDDKRKRVTSVMLPPELREVIADYAQHRGCSQSEAIRILLEAGAGLRSSEDTKRAICGMKLEKKQGSSSPWEKN